MTDPYQQYPRQQGQYPYGGQPPYGQGQPNPYGQQDPYGAHGSQQEPYGQPNPYGGQGGAGGAGGYGQGGGQGGGPDGPGQQPNPYGPPKPYGQPDHTRQYQQPGAYDPDGPPRQSGGHTPCQDRPHARRPDQYGQYQGSYGQTPGWGAGGYPPGPPPKSKLPMILFSVLAVLVILGGVVVAMTLLNDDETPPVAQTTTAQPTQTSDSAPPTSSADPTTTTSGGDDAFEVGQCATLTPEPGNRATLNETTCGGSNSDVLVAKVQEGECVRDYITFNADLGKVYCLALDAEEGTCFTFDQLAKRALNCASGSHKVARIFEDVTDSSKCDEVQGADRRYSYPEPARTVCLIPAG